jgi:Reverse transcriptase (RNA-dependent DNA polymerase)
MVEDKISAFTVQGKEGKVYKLTKAIYGLKQVGRQWHMHLEDTLNTLGFQKNLAGDVSVFIKRNDEGNHPTIMLVYVDDITIIGILAAISDLKAKIGTHYKITYLGEINHFLGIRITHDRSKKMITIDQSHYIDCMLTRYDMTQCKSAYTPFAPSTKLTPNMVKFSDSSITSKSQQIVGSLMYAMLGSRPDICFAVNRLSQFGSNPTEEHLLAAQHVLRYLSTMRGHSVTYGKNDSTEIVSYSDSDWANNTEGRRSTSGYIFILSGGSIAWATQKQRIVALSSTEAEYMALTECTKHAQWTISLLQQLDFEVELPLDTFSDSLGARAIAANAVFHKRTKHIDVKYHYIRDCIKKGIIEISAVTTKDNAANILTKPLPCDQHKKLSSKLGISDCSIAGEC